MDRRDFIKIAGLSTLGLAAKPIIDAFARVAIPEENAITASKWAMVVDLQKCAENPDCGQLCIKACHQMHNVPDMGNPKDEIKWIWQESFEHVFEDQALEYVSDHLKRQPTLVLCNHCNNPPCVKVCPTQATWRRVKDGVVMMDWHRCIGCRYCLAACPYGARSFNWRDPRPHIKKISPDFPTRMRGVVEKCTFCEERLARGKIPACVEACTFGALTFGDLEDAESAVRELLRASFTVRRKPGLGTQPSIFYIVRGEQHAG
jgi:molybdopterin-containing oxidoreductase family iron-sulfur binding subunit